MVPVSISTILIDVFGIGNPTVPLYSVLQDVVLRNPNKISLKFIGKQYTFSELKDMVDDAAERRGVIQERREKVKTPNLEFSQF